MTRRDFFQPHYNNWIQIKGWLLGIVGSVGCRRTSLEQKPVNMSFLYRSISRSALLACNFFFGSLLFILNPLLSQKLVPRWSICFVSPWTRTTKRSKVFLFIELDELYNPQSKRPGSSQRSSRKEQVFSPEVQTHKWRWTRSQWP